MKGKIVLVLVERRQVIDEVDLRRDRGVLSSKQGASLDGNASEVLIRFEDSRGNIQKSKSGGFSLK